MEYTEASLGRVFIVKLDQGEIIHEAIERIAGSKGIAAGAVLVVGGGDKGSRLVVGPESSGARPIALMEHLLGDAHEIAGVGTLISTEDGKPVLHMHITAGRGKDSVTGCIRRGVRVWGFLEVVIIELTETSAVKRYDESMQNYMLYTRP